MADDPEIQQLMEDAEPGVTALLADYEAIEQHYYAAASTTAIAPPIIYSTTTPAAAPTPE